MGAGVCDRESSVKCTARAPIELDRDNMSDGGDLFLEEESILSCQLILVRM